MEAEMPRTLHPGAFAGRSCAPPRPLWTRATFPEICRRADPQSPGEERAMKRHLAILASAAPLLVTLALAPPASAQQAGGTLRIRPFDSPASLFMFEESTLAT